MPDLQAVSVRRPVWLRRRLIVVLAAVVLIVTVGLGAASTAVLRSQLIAQVNRELDQASRMLTLPPPPGPPDADRPRAGSSEPPTTADSPPGFPAGIGPGSIVLRRVDDETVLANYVMPSLEQRTLTGEQVATLTAVPTDGRPHVVDLDELGSFRAVHRAGDGLSSVVAMNTETVDTTVGRYVLVQVALGVAALLAAVLACAWLVRRALRPLDEVAAAASRVSELELARGGVSSIPRVPDALTNERMEVGQVGAALNRMLENVEGSLQARHESETQVRSFVADASHELRTPLASIRGYAELVRRTRDDLPPSAARSLDRIESEAVRMTDLVDDLLLLARLDAGRPLDRTPVDLSVLAAEAVTDAHAVGPEHFWSLDLLGGELPDGQLADGALPEGTLPDGALEDPDYETTADGLTVTGDEAHLRQVLANLLTNARLHTPPGTHVGVRLVRDGDAVTLTVSDDGPGIPANLHPTLFHRFSRGDAARNRTNGSTGLGLAITAAIVTAHGGQITVDSATAHEADRTGTTFTVRLPREATTQG